MKFLYTLVGLPFKAVLWVKWKVYRGIVISDIAKVGKGFIFDPITTTIVTPDLLTIGDYCFLNKEVYISGNVSFQNHILVGPRVAFLSGNHLYGVFGKSVRFLKATEHNSEIISNMVIEDEVWIAANAILLGGISVGMGSIIGAGSIVKHNVPPFTMCVGNPCIPVRKIFDDDRLHAHLCALGYSELFSLSIVAKRNELLKKYTSLKVIESPLPSSFFYDEPK